MTPSFLRVGGRIELHDSSLFYFAHKSIPRCGDETVRNNPAVAL